MRKLDSKTITALCALFSAAMLSACSGGAAKANTAGAPATAKSAAIDVTTAAVVAREVPTIIRATGTFVADDASDVAAPVSGQVIKTLVEIGDTVKAGQPLVLLDDRDAGLRLDQARASLARAQADAEHAKADASRSNELFQKGFTSRSDYERLATADTGAAAAVAQARALLATAEKAVADSVVRAPFAGHVTARPVSAGESVTPASKIATIVRIQPIKLELLVKESDAVKVQPGQRVQAEVSGYPGVLFSGSVSARNVAIDPNSRAMTVEAIFPNADSRVKPGMFGTAQIQLPLTETAIYAPANAVRKVAEADTVFVVQDTRVQLRVVQLGATDGGMIRVDSGLEAGATVATNNLDQLADGASVSVR